MTTHFQAIAPDGTIISRSSQTRQYTWAMVYFNKSSKKWGATFSSRRDLAEKERSRYANASWMSQCTVVPVAVVTSKKARAVTKSKVTDADKLATKVAAKLRKAGVNAAKRGEYVRVHVPQVWVGHDNLATRDVESWYLYYFSEGSKIQRRNKRLARLIVRRAVERAGYQLDRNCWYVVL